MKGEKGRKGRMKNRRCEEDKREERKGCYPCVEFCIKRTRRDEVEIESEVSDAESVRAGTVFEKS